MRALITVLLSLMFVCPALAQSEDTIANFRETLVKTPDDGATHYALASYLMDNGGDLGEAALHFERAGELEFQPQGIIYRLPRINARRGQYPEALQQIETLAEGGIFYTAETVNPADGSVTLHKFEFTQYENGDVRQFWQTSTDGGETYSTIWDGRYAPKE